MHYRTHTCGELTLKEDKKEIKLSGWAQRIRDHGGKKFIDLRDREGMTQVVFDPDITKDFEKVEDLKREYLITVSGKVRPRPEGTINEKMKTGEVEIIVSSFEVISTCDVLPFELDSEHVGDVNEELRLEYRYLDLRRPEMFDMLKKRHQFLTLVRNFMNERDFLEIETPNLTKSTPEGSRDFLVPYRKKKGEFFALPQSPQMFKQMLMVSGVEKYFQIATCFRDEDLRKDRQYEHKQIDMEIAFASRDELFKLTEELFVKAFKEVFGIELKAPFPVLEYAEVMEKYGSDKPDLRIKDLELKNISELAKGCGFSVFKTAVEREGLVKGLNLKKGQELLTRKDIDKLIELAQQDWGAKGLAWMKVTEEGIESSIAKFFNEKELKEIQKSLEGEVGDLLFFAADTKEKTNDILDGLRRHLAQRFELYTDEKHSFSFIVNFPLFKWDDEQEAITFEHSPFTMVPKDAEEFLMSLKVEDIKKNKEKLTSFGSEAYDLVYNGVELGSGALRIHKPKLQKKIFELMGMSEERIQENFGWFMKAYNYAAPPHRGWGLGIDRVLMIAQNKASIRDVIPFPRNKHGFDPLTASPSSVDEKQLRELSLEVKKEKK